MTRRIVLLLTLPAFVACSGASDDAVAPEPDAASTSGDARDADEPPPNDAASDAVANDAPGPTDAGADAADATPEPPATYYVSPTGSDSNPGTLAAPFRTIQKAANVVVPGDVVEILDGTYEEPSINVTRSGTAAKRIVFRAKNKWQAILASTSGCNPGLSIAASYITVRGLRLSLSPKNVTCPTYTSSNVAIRAWNSVDPKPSNPTTGHVGFIADGVKVDPGPGRAEAIKSNQDFSVIENSESGNALELFNCKDCVIRNNLVNGQDKFGISIFVKGGVRSARVYGNVVRNKASEGFGIYLGGYSCDKCFFDESAKIEAYNSVAYDNVVVNDGSGTLHALIFAGAKDCAFFNNVVVGGHVVTMPGGHNEGFRAPTRNPRLENNIVVCRPGSAAMSGPYEGSRIVDRNDFHDCSAVPPQANPVVGDPLFVNRLTDWHLQPASPARNKGGVVSFVGYDGTPIDVSHDKDGAKRTVPWDLGVYEH